MLLSSKQFTHTCSKAHNPITLVPGCSRVHLNRALHRASAATAKTTNGSSRPNSPMGSTSPLSSTDEVDRQLQQAAQYQLAYQQGTLAFGFSAGGLLFPYYLGVAQQLEELNILQPSTQLAGASAGSLIVACVKSGMTFSTLKDACFELARDCRQNGTRHRLRHVLEGTLRDMLPDDVAERCSGRIHVAVTHLTPGLRPTLVSQFHDREDLIQALLTSCHIPWYFDGSWFRSFRSTPAFDGGITNFLPSVPGNTTCRVCCLPRQQLAAIRNISISPDAFTEWPYNVQQMLNWALEPADEEQLDMLLECGRRDALTWAQQTGLAVLASTGRDSSDVQLASNSIEQQPGIFLPAPLADLLKHPAQGGRLGQYVSQQQEQEQEQPVGTSLVGLMKTLLVQSRR